MKFARKRPVSVKAWQLGRGSSTELLLLQEGRLRLTADRHYELLSQESGSTGELAEYGDWFKIDGDGFPYPNKAAWFSAHHRHIKDDLYEQISEPLPVWFAGDAPTPEIEWLLHTERLTLKPEDEAHYFNAFLWGAPLSSPIDSALVMYAVDRDEQGSIIDISFNFVARSEFDRTYEMV